MMNERLINEAVELVIDYFEAEGIAETTTTIRMRANAWYNNTEITDAYMLAAAVIHGNYDKSVTWSQLEQIADFYFPEPVTPEFLSHFSVGEIEESLRDEFWR